MFKNNEQVKEEVSSISNHFPMGNEEAIKTIIELKSILENHSGPYSKYAIIDNPFVEMFEPVFTSDGFNIMRSIEVDTPVAKMIHKMVVYIGNKISSHIGDGTTTGMLITLNLLHDLFLNEKISNTFNEYTFADLDKFSKIIFHLLNERIEETKITIDRVLSKINNQLERSEIIRGISYAQAFTSSHGDREISEVIAEMFVDLPEESLNNLAFIRSGWETAEKITLRKEDHQYNCPSDILTPFMLNAENQTKIYGENVTVDLFNPTLVIESPETQALINNIKENYIEGKNYLVVATGACQQTRMTLQKLFIDLRREVTHNVMPVFGVCFVPIVETLMNDVLILSLASGIKYPQTSKVNRIENVTVEFEKGQLRFGNLYEEVSEIHPNLRPWYKNIEYEAFNNIFQNLEDLIKKIKETKTDLLSNETYKEYIRLRNLLVLNKRVLVVIGGNGYDNSTLVDIVEDCVSAVKKSLTKGFVPAGLLSSVKTFQAISNMFKYPDYKEKLKAYNVSFDNYQIDKYKFKEEDIPVINTLIGWFSEAIFETSKSFIKIENIGAYDVEGYDNVEEHISYDVVTDTGVYLYSKNLWDRNLISSYTHANVIIQPADTDITIFRRIQEVVLKIAYSVDFLYKQRSV